MVVDDYGHHPTEIRATLERRGAALARGAWSSLFQPHRYTRTQALWDEFCRRLSPGGRAAVTDIYPAGEEPIPGVTAEALVEALAEKGHRHASYAGPLASATQQLVSEARPDDVVLTLGAGSVWTAGEEVLRVRRSAR